jgi:hypothetical protein
MGPGADLQQIEGLIVEGILVSLLAGISHVGMLGGEILY